MNPFLEAKKGRPFGSITTANRAEKKCSGCKTTQTLNNFYLDSGRPDRRDSYCIPCRKELLRKTKMKHPKPKRILNKELRRTYWDMKCLLCNNSATPAHVKTVGSRGDDVPHNIVPLCLLHHGEQGSMPIAEFAEKYPRYKQWLIDNGWKLDTFLGKWLHES